MTCIHTRPVHIADSQRARNMLQVRRITVQTDATGGGEHKTVCALVTHAVGAPFAVFPTTLALSGCIEEPPCGTL